MAFNVGGGADGDDLPEVSDINVTPFIDVMLVLLIIFMVAAPLATVDVPVDLPASTAGAAKRPDRPLFLSARADGSLLVGDAPVAREALGAGLDAATGTDRTTRVFVRADKGMPYGDVMGVLDALRTAGYLKVALVGLDRSQAAAVP